VLILKDVTLKKYKFDQFIIHKKHVSNRFTITFASLLMKASCGVILPQDAIAVEKRLEETIDQRHHQSNGTLGLNRSK